MALLFNYLFLQKGHKQKKVCDNKYLYKQKLSQLITLIAQVNVYILFYLRLVVAALNQI